jgi:phage/plasmid-like protein (TIGR03299 family)
MAHELDFTTGKAAIAYIGDKPWHGYGQKMQAGQSIEDWKMAAGMNFEIMDTDVQFATGFGRGTLPTKKVLYRSDTGDALAVVGKGYRVVQPGEVLEFYRDLTAKAGFTLETAGVLKHGKKYWALASIGQEAKLFDDTIKGYLLLGTACDGSMATTAMFTSIRVVCNNTLGFAMNEVEHGQNKNFIRIAHRSEFDEAKVKAQLGIAATSWTGFMASVETWSETPVTSDQAREYFNTVSSYNTTAGDTVISHRTSDKLMALFSGQGKGSNLKSASGTVWGLVNAVTEYVDHHRGRTDEVRMDRAFFGDGIATKALATRLADEIAFA